MCGFNHSRWLYIGTAWDVETGIWRRGPRMVSADGAIKAVNNVLFEALCIGKILVECHCSSRRIFVHLNLQETSCSKRSTLPLPRRHSVRSYVVKDTATVLREN